MNTHRVTVLIVASAAVMGLMPSSTHARSGQNVFTAPYTRGNPGSVTDCSPGADVCSASGDGGAAGVFNIASEVTRNEAITAEHVDIAYGFASAVQRIKVPTGVSQITVNMTFHSSQMATDADASRGWADTSLLVFADASEGYCRSANECTATQGKATLASSYDNAGFIGLPPPPSEDVGPDAVATLTISAPSASTLPNRPLYVVGSAVSLSALGHGMECLNCLDELGHAGRASSSATVTLQQMTVSFS